MESKRQYNRKKNKADDEVLPYLFLKRQGKTNSGYNPGKKNESNKNLK